jgi:hypothetical protein
MALNPALMAALKGAKAKHSRGGITPIKKVKEGKTKVRILPGLGPDGIFWQDLGLHWIKPEPNGKPMAVAGCQDHTYDRPCPICTAIDKALKATSDDDQVKLYKEWSARKEVLVNAIIRTGPDASEDPVVLSLTSTTFTAICSMVEEYADEVGDILDLENGMDFIIERTGKGLDTKYGVMPAPKSAPVPAGVMDKAINLAEFVEKEFFSGKDTKALNAIATVSGVTPTVGYATKAMLTGPSGGSIVDAEVVEDTPPFETAPATKPAAAAPKTTGKALSPADDLPENIEDILGDLDNI